MKYLTPEIAKLAKKNGNSRGKPIAKPGISCGIFQDCMDTKVTYSKQMVDFNKKKK